MLSEAEDADAGEARLPSHDPDRVAVLAEVDLELAPPAGTEALGFGPVADVDLDHVLVPGGDGHVPVAVLQPERGSGPDVEGFVVVPLDALGKGGRREQRGREDEKHEVAEVPIRHRISPALSCHDPV